MNKALCFWKTFYIFYFINIIKAAPPLYCNQQIDTSDCGGTPTPVFTFYKPGSRCDIEIWRGCATMNKFDDEYQCTHSCIFQYIKSSEDTSAELLMHNESNCDKDLNTTKCTDEILPVYTYKIMKKKCVQANWKGCSTNNKFADKKSCIDNCMPKTNKTDFLEKLNDLLPEDTNNINVVLKKILNDDSEDLNLTTEFVTEETTVDITSITDFTKEAVDEISNEKITTNQETITDTVVDTLSTTELIASAETTTEAPATELTLAPTTETTVTPTPTTTIRSKGKVKEVVLPDDSDDE